MRGISLLFELALTRLDFVAAKVFLGLFVPCVSAGDWVVSTLAQLVWVVLGVLGGVNTVAGKDAYEADQFTLGVLLCHLLLA